MSAGQSAFMPCGWRVKAGMAQSVCGKGQERIKPVLEELYWIPVNARIDSELF